jgi:hypothetical protein
MCTGVLEGQFSQTARKCSCSVMMSRQGDEKLGRGQTGRSPISTRHRIGERSVRLRFTRFPENRQLLHFLFNCRIRSCRNCRSGSCWVSSMRRILAVVGGGLLGRCPCVPPVLARTSQFTTYPAPQEKNLRHGQLLYSSCTVRSGGLLRKLSYERGCQEKNSPPPPRGDVDVVICIQPLLPS